MSELPHVIAGDKTTEELYRITEVWNGLQTSPAAGLYCLDPDCDCREARDEESAP